jgi:hypothetical protein
VEQKQNGVHIGTEFEFLAKWSLRYLRHGGGDISNDTSSLSPRQYHYSGCCVSLISHTEYTSGALLPYRGCTCR